MSETCTYEEIVLDEFCRQVDESNIKIDTIKDMAKIDDRWAKNMKHMVQNLSVGKTLCAMMICIHELRQEIKQLKEKLSAKKE